MKRSSPSIYRRFFAMLAVGQYRLLALSKTDFSARLADWAMLFGSQLLEAISYSFVFTVTGIFHTENMPYLPWLLCGIIPWFFFKTSVTLAAQSLHDYAPLWQSAACPPGLLPLARIYASLPLFLLWLVVAIVVCSVFSVLSPNWIMLPYYVLCTALYSTAQGYMAAAFAPFYPDVSQGVALTMLLTFWGTPIVWPISALSGLTLSLAKLNPLLYLTEGLRNCLLYGTFPAWNDTIWFFMLTFAFFAIGCICFARLQKHYREVMH